MPYKADTQQGAYDAFQRKALPHLSAIAKYCGVPLAMDKEWEYHGHNEYGKHKERDHIAFGDLAIQVIKEVREAPQKSALEPKFAIVDDIINDTSTPLEFNESYTETRASRKLDESSTLAAWSLKVSHEHEVEAEASFAGIGAKGHAKTTIEAETHGEYSEHHLREENDEHTSTVGIKGTAPPHSTYFVEQEIDKAIITQGVHQFLIAEVHFEVHDWKGLDSNTLKNSSRKKSLRHGQTHSLLVIESTEDFRQFVTGVHPDYPNQRTNFIKTKTPIQKHVKWLVDPKNRAIRVDLVLKYEDAISGHTRVIDRADSETAKEIAKAFPTETSS